MAKTSSWPINTDGIRFLLPNFLVQDLARHELSNDLYPLAFGFYPKARGHLMERKHAEDDLFILCTQGKGKLLVTNEDGGQQHYLVEPGSLIYLKEGSCHFYESDSTDPWTIYWCHFSGLKSKTYSAGLQGSGAVKFVGFQPKLIHDFEQLLDTRQSGFQLDTFIYAANILKQMLTYIASIKGGSFLQKKQSLDLDLIHSFMQENIHQQLDLESVANLVHLSKYHFSKKYKELTGQSPIQHFIHLKMEHACYLLDITDHAVGKISRTLSYEDPHYFSRIFKKTMGVSPKEYRLLKRG